MNSKKKGPVSNESWVMDYPLTLSYQIRWGCSILISALSGRISFYELASMAMSLDLQASLSRPNVIREDLLGPHLCRPKAKALPSSSSGSADIQGRSTQIYHDTSDLVRKVSEMGAASIWVRDPIHPSKGGQRLGISRLSGHASCTRQFTIIRKAPWWGGQKGSDREMYFDGTTRSPDG